MPSSDRGCRSSARPAAPGLGEGGPVPDRDPRDRPRRSIARRDRRRIVHRMASGTRRSTRPAEARPAVGRRHARSRRADGPAARPDATMTRPRCPAWAARTVPAPDPIARDYLLLGLAWTSTSRGSSTATSARPTSRPWWTWSNSGRRRLAARDAAALRARLDEVAEPDRRDWLDAQLIALETQAARLAGEALPYLDHVTRCFSFEPHRAGTIGSSRPPPRRSTLLYRARAPSRSGWRRGMRSSSSRSSGCRRRRPACDPLPGARAGALRACRRARTCGCRWSRPAVVRLQLVRRRASVPRGHQHRPAGPGPDLFHIVAHETYPGHHLEHAWKEADLVDSAGSDGGLDPAHQHAGVPHQRGARRRRGCGSPPPRTSSSTCCSRSTARPASRSAGIRSPPAMPPSGRSRSWSRGAS